MSKSVPALSYIYFKKGLSCKIMVLFKTAVFIHIYKCVVKVTSLRRSSSWEQIKTFVYNFML